MSRYQLAVLLAIMALAIWVMDTFFFHFIHLDKPFLDQLLFDIPAAEFYERLTYVAIFIAGVFLTYTLTQRHKKAREGLGEGERLLEAILQSIQEGLIIKDRNLRIIRMNPLAAQWYEHAGRLQGQSCYQALKGRTEPCEHCPSILALDSGQPASMVVPKMGPGERQVGWLDLYSYPLVDPVSGKTMGVIEFARDVTDVKQAEEALRESESRFKLLVKSIPAVVFKGYSDWSIDFFDDKIEELTGYPKEEFDSRRMKWTDVMLPEDFEGAREIFIQALKTTKSYVREYRIRHQDGRILWIQARGQIICADQGQVDYISGVFFDITERKQAEEALRQSEAKYRTLVEHIPAITYIVPSAETNIKPFISPQIQNLIGFSPGDFQTDPDIWSAHLHPDDHDRVLAEVAHTWATGEAFSSEYRLVAQDGRIIWFRDEGALVCNETGQPLFLQGVMVDITARKEMEEALRRSEARLAEAQRISHVGNWEGDMEIGEGLWSDEVYRIFGYAPQELNPSYETFLSLVHPEDREMVNLKVQEAISTGLPYHTGYRIVLPDGSERFLYSKAEVTLGSEGRRTRLVGTVQDITDLKQAQDALKESEQRYRLLAENISDVIWTADFNLRLTYVSPSILLQRGYTPEEVMAQSPEEMMTPSSLELVRARLREELAQELAGQVDPSRFASLEMELLCKDGSTVWVEVRANFLRDEQGRPVGILGVSRDITERRKLQEQLQQAQKMEVVGRLAGGVAHDFNNLLTAILGYSGILLDTLEPHDPARRDVTEIKNAGERAALLTRQLLAFSRRQVLQPKSMDLNQVVVNLGNMLTRVMGEDIEVIIDPDQDLGHIKADPGQIEQVILNLAVNARDAMPHGGSLLIKSANVVLDETYARSHALVQPGAYVLLQMRDTGCGMDPETRSHIFEPFFTTKEQGKGTGLGLSTVYGIIRQSGGHIWVDSEPGKGTTFNIYLPRMDLPAGRAAPEEASWPGDKGRETILLVEDEDLVRQITRRILQAHGYTVLEARGGQEALQICEQHQGRVHLLLTDLVMPGINGRELADRLASRFPNTKVIFMSGYAENGIAGTDMIQEDIGYLQKPFEAHVLTRKVRELLDAA